LEIKVSSNSIPELAKYVLKIWLINLKFSLLC
jgi:hypothetical protein